MLNIGSCGSEGSAGSENESMGIWMLKSIPGIVRSNHGSCGSEGSAGSENESAGIWMLKSIPGIVRSNHGNCGSDGSAGSENESAGIWNEQLEITGHAIGTQTLVLTSDAAPTPPCATGDAGFSPISTDAPFRTALPSCSTRAAPPDSAKQIP